MRIMSLTRGEAYAIIELPVGANPDSIKGNYKRLAMKWHPDKHKGSNYNDALWKFQQVGKAYKRLTTDQDVSSMTLEEIYELYQQTFHKNQPAHSYSNGTDSLYDSDADSDDYKDNDFNSSETRNNGVELTEEEKERKKLEKRKAKKKLRKEKKKLEKQEYNKDENGKHIDITGKSAPDKKADIFSGSDSENFDADAAFYSQVMTKKRKSTGNTDSSNLQQQQQLAQQKLKQHSTVNNNGDTLSSNQRTRGVESEGLGNNATSHHFMPQQSSHTEENWEHIDPVILQSRQLAIQGNEMANAGHYEPAINLFSDAIKLDPKDFRFFGNRSYCYDRIQQFDRALHDAECAIRLAAEWPKGYFRKGRALAGLKRYAEAEESFIHVLKLDSTCEDAIQELNRIRTLQLMDMGFTAQEVENALSRYPTFPQALDSLLSGLANNGLSLRSGGDTAAQQHAQQSRSANSSQQPLHPIPASNYQQAALRIQQNQQQQQQQQQHSNMSHHSTHSVDVKMDPNNPEGLSALWVGNVLPEVSDKKLTQMFSKYGTVTSVRCLPDKFCAFVNFKDKECASKALKNLQGVECAGQKLLIKFPDNPVNTGNVILKKSAQYTNNSNGKKSNTPVNKNNKNLTQRYKK